MNVTFYKATRRASLCALSFCATALALTLANAQTPEPAPARPATQAPVQDGGRGQRGGNNNNNIQRGNFGGGLNFDEKQRELLQEARQVNNDELRKLNEKLAEAQKEFVKAVVAEKYDEPTVKAKADAVGKIQAEIMALNGKAFATVSPTLKPEQRESLEGNARIGIAIISPAGGIGGGPGGNFTAGPAAGFGGGRGGPDAAGGADRTMRRGGERGERFGGAPGAPGTPEGGNPRRRGGDNPGQ
jgi:Spy/CpxP family protein refolding chaperone